MLHHTETESQHEIHARIHYISDSIQRGYYNSAQPISDESMISHEPPGSSLLDFAVTVALKQTAEASPLELMPSFAQCVVHLKLLHAINRLRRDILNSQPLDEALNIKPEIILIQKKIYHAKELRRPDETFAKRREAKWELYLHLAVGRFLVWLKRMDHEMDQSDSKDASYLELPFCPPLGSSF
jgi:hypothetical protein